MEDGEIHEEMDEEDEPIYVDYGYDEDEVWAAVPDQQPQQPEGTSILDGLIFEADRALKKINTFLALSEFHQNLELVTKKVVIRLLPEPDMGYQEAFMSSDDEL